LADQVREHIAKYGYMTMASGLNSTLAEILGGGQAGREFLTLAYNNIEKNSLLSECEKLNGSKGFSASEKTVRKDLKMLVDSRQIESRQETVELDGKQYSPVVVYGSLDAFRADIEQARVVLAEQDQSPFSDFDVKPTVVAAEVEPLPFSQDVADKLKRYRISRDEWRKDTVGGALAAVTFASLIDQVDDKTREAVLKIPAPEVFSTNLALKQVLANKQSGLKILRRWVEN
jgi:hypothetical protein